jgi:hypothetical protein
MNVGMQVSTNSSNSAVVIELLLFHLRDLYP